MSRSRGWWLLVPFAVGMTLRLWRLPQQILGGDEIHAVLAALYRPLGTILTTYFPSDSCIPLSALYRLWVAAGGDLTEMGLRVPVLLTAAVFLLVIPLLLARDLGRSTAMAFAGLAAISPGLVLYGRVVRSYMPVVLWGSLAALAFWVWWHTGRRRWAGIYVLGAALALWFHLGAGPFVVAPFLFAAGDLVIRKDGEELRPGWRALEILGALTVGAFLVFLLPAAESLSALTVDKRIDQTIPIETLGGALQLVAGTVRGWPAVLFWLVALGGLVRLCSRRPALALYTVSLVAVHIVGLRFLSPLGLEQPAILFRYHLIALPVVLLWAATALAEVPGPRHLRPVVAGLLLLGLFLAGPLVSWDFLHGSFHHHNDFLAYVRPRPRLIEKHVPAIYRELAASDEPGAVLEYPWTYFWMRAQVFPLYQRIHRREVLVAFAEEGPVRPRLDLRNAVSPTREDFLASRARFLILHLDFGTEQSRVLGPGRIRILEHLPAERRRLATMARRMAGWLERSWGPPVYRDRWVRVWDLEAVRSGDDEGSGDGSSNGSR